MSVGRPVPTSMRAAKPSLFWPCLGAASVLFHLGLIFSGLTPNLVSRPLHLALALPWIFVYAGRYGRNRAGPATAVTGAVLTALGVVICVAIAVYHEPLSDQYGVLHGPAQLMVGLVLIAIVLELARRAIGWPLPLIAALFLCYGLYGQHIPGEFGHAGIPMPSFIGTLTITEGGLWGTLTGISVSVVAIFVILGATLNAGEAGRGFMNVAIAAAGGLKGGAAKVSVLSSALFGSISGSASANVASTGMVTLPTMRQLGYPKRVAAAVEAVASTGGQIMPPLMGAGAFVMVELTGVPYTGIILAAALPALLYFFTVWAGVDVYADRYGLRPYAAADRPAKAAVLRAALFFLLPFSVLLALMFGGYTPQFAATVAIILAAALLFFDADFKFRFKQGIARLRDAAEFAGRQIALIAAIIICASLIVGVLGITGLGVKLTSVILSLADASLWPALLLTALACIVLGMEVPTTAAYVICVSVAGPALVNLGLEPLAAHLFVFWYALLSTITPPVCGGVFIAAGMVGENWLKVALTAMALGLGLYFIPLGMIYHPALIGLGATPFAALLTGLQMAVGLALVSRAIISTAPATTRVALAAAGCLVLVLRLE